MWLCYSGTYKQYVEMTEHIERDLQKFRNVTKHLINSVNKVPYLTLYTMCFEFIWQLIATWALWCFLEDAQYLLEFLGWDITIYKDVGAHVNSATIYELLTQDGTYPNEDYAELRVTICQLFITCRGEIVIYLRA